jgi:hypothetical protein
MLSRRPLTWGLILGASSHLLEWLPILLHTMLKPQRDIWIFVGLALVLVRLISFCCLNLNVTTEANTWREGYRFALGWLGISILLLIIEFTLFYCTNVLSHLDPHSSFLTGLAYIFFWMIWAISVAVQLLIAGIQTLLRVHREHCDANDIY